MLPLSLSTLFILVLAFTSFFHSNKSGKRFFRNFNIYKSLSTNSTRNELGTVSGGREENIKTELE
jgi:hypothetical protein